MELAIVLIVTIVAAILGGTSWPLFSERFRRPRCYLLRPDDDPDLIGKVLTYYTDRIHHEERIPPDLLRYYLRSPDHSVDSISKLKEFCNVAEKTVHAFLYVIYASQVIGVAKIIYLCNTQIYFFAYYAASANNTVSSGEILNSIISVLRSQLDDSAVIVYEVCDVSGNPFGRKAKERLFGDYARARHFFVRTLIPEYLQPDVSETDGRYAQPISGSLIAISRNKDSLSDLDVEEILEDILTSLYLDTYISSGQDNPEGYKVYLSHIQNMIMKNAPR